ncbi:hypothetical protein GOP47_0022740 [Adiantum capillus-veneris]|uniref:Uncharacterized protein n=1 Tax=Adiantum capillus-veneris TaxID=13818 RepID=A0A9D4Z753_ADICA|nr:hypothetical protein GOP47_0022740 [Adiantum capillus-veneris]
MGFASDCEAGRHAIFCRRAPRWKAYMVVETRSLVFGHAHRVRAPCDSLCGHSPLVWRTLDYGGVDPSFGGSIRGASSNSSMVAHILQVMELPSSPFSSDACSRLSMGGPQISRST